MMNHARSRRLALATAVMVLSVGGFATAANAQDSGTTYYVSPEGSTSADGSAPSPFRTVQQCADVLVAGDTCEIATGTYRETVTPANSGTAGARITYTAAPGAEVVITGADEVTGWDAVTTADLAALEADDPFLAGSGFADAVNGGHISKTSITLDPDLTGNQVFVNGWMRPEAAWPYPGIDPIAPTMGSAQSGTNTSLSDTALTQPDGFWVGARLRAHNWFVSETGRVTSSSVGSVTAASLPPCVSLSPNQQTNYSLSGKLALLADPGTWFYDQDAGELYLWAPDGASPEDVTVEAKQRSVAVDLSDRSYTSVQDLDIRASTIITSATSSNNILDRLNAQYVSADADLAPDPNMVTTPDGCAVLTAGETTTGIQLNGTGNELRNSLVNWSSGNGVVVSGTGNTVTNNTITNADYLGSYAAGINLLGADHTITHNTVFRTGRSSINIDNKIAGTTASGITIAHNDMSNYNNLVVDGGAVYVCCKVDLASTVIRNNQFHDPAPLASSAPAPGVYLDNGAFNATVINNVAWNRTSYGVTLINPDGGPTSGNTILNNTSGTDTNVASTFGGQFSTTELTNNIGIVGSGAGITASNNLVPVSSAQFTNPAAYDFSLQATSPARNAAVVRPGVTDGFTDANPSIGAYQYGAPKWTAGATRTGSKIQAESFTSSSGVSTHQAATGTVVGSFDGGDWIGYDGVDFGDGRDLFTANIGVEDQYAGQTIEIRLDSATGPVIGTLHVAGTGGFDTVSQQSAAITRTAGVHTVFLVAAGSRPGVGNIDDFTFSTTR